MSIIQCRCHTRFIPDLGWRHTNSGKRGRQNGTTFARHVSPPTELLVRTPLCDRPNPVRGAVKSGQAQMSRTWADGFRVHVAFQ